MRFWGLRAVKRSEEGKRVIVRVYNPSSGRHEGEIHFYFPVFVVSETNLNEETIRSLPVKNYTTIRLEVKPKAIKTIALIIDPGVLDNFNHQPLKRSYL